MVRGDRIIYFLKEDRSIVETENEEKKVKAVIVPQEGKEGAGSK